MNSGTLVLEPEKLVVFGWGLFFFLGGGWASFNDFYYYIPWIDLKFPAKSVLIQYTYSMSFIKSKKFLHHTRSTADKWNSVNLLFCLNFMCFVF